MFKYPLGPLDPEGQLFLKSIKVIALLAGLQRNETLRNILIIVPATLQKQWVQEFNKWWPMLRIKVLSDGKRIKPETVYLASYERARSQVSIYGDIANFPSIQINMK